MLHPHTLWLYDQPGRHTPPPDQSDRSDTIYAQRHYRHGPTQEIDLEDAQGELEFLKMRIYERRHGVSQQVQLKYAPRPTYKTAWPLETRIPLGLVLVAAKLLDNRGQRMTYRDRLYHALPRPVELINWNPDRGLLDFISDWHGGVIRTDGQINVVRIVEQMVKAWPQFKLLVVVRKLDDACCLHADLDRLFDGVQLVSRADTPGDARIYVAAVQDVGPCKPPLARLDLVLLLDGRLLAREKLYEDLRDEGGARIYSVLRMTAKLKPLEADRINSLCGLAEYRLFLHGQSDVPVFVRTVMNRHGRRLPKHAHIGTVKEQVIWQNYQRNLFVAKTARREKNRLARLRREASLPDGDSSLLAVVVENGLHAHELSKVLTEFDVIDNPDNLDQQYERAFARAMKHKTGVVGLIVTEQTVRADLTAMLVRADAGLGLLLDPRQVHEDRSLPLVIHDIVDDHPRKLVEFSKARHRAYHRAGFVLDGEVQDRREIERYLDQHPPAKGT